MDDFTRKHDSRPDEEKSFAETLISESGSAEIPHVQPSAAEAKAVPKQQAWVGKVMGHFRLLRLIGEGAMGMVIQAEDTGLRRIVALKVLRKQLSVGEKGKKAVEQFCARRGLRRPLHIPTSSVCMRSISTPGGGISRWKWWRATACRRS